MNRIDGNMKVNADLYVKDVPGQLVGTLDPISMVDGNIVGVVHNREKVMDQRIGVNITFEIPSAENLERLKEIWKSRDVVISRMGSVVETYSMEYMLVGKVSVRSIEELLEKAKKKISIESLDLRISSKASSSRHAAMISAQVRKKEDVRKLDSFIASEFKGSGVACIRGVDE